MTLWQRWKQTSLSNKWLTIGTVAIAAANIGYVVVALFTLREIRLNSVDTRAIATAAKTQADAAKSLTDLTAKEFDINKRITESNNEAICTFSVFPNRPFGVFMIYVGNRGKVNALNVLSHLDIFVATVPDLKRVKNIERTHRGVNA